MTTKFVATPVEVCPETMAQSSYQRESGDWHNVTRNFEALDMPHEVLVSNYVTEYDHDMKRPDGDTETVSTSVVISTPKVERFGQSMNPIAQWSPTKLAREFAGRLDGYGSLQDFTRNGTYSLTVADRQTTATRFDAVSQTADDDTERVVVDVALASYHDNLIVMATATRPTTSTTDVRTPVGTTATCLTHRRSTS
ncbi:hypothetical protein EGH23_03310 [Halomicroarcula sp. F27]|uniref:Uncharacterized protein n=2 Tax=Haloarcula nitratireducens TaxID=2487749 RepID=A0AAW4P7J0_9EURY|nr:hypothetical protein [Halomicroarcula nitratireducens]